MARRNKRVKEEVTFSVSNNSTMRLDLFYYNGDEIVNFTLAVNGIKKIPVKFKEQFYIYQNKNLIKIQ